MWWMANIRRLKILTAAVVGGTALAACDDGRPFNRDRIGTAATKLAVPTTITPPVRVGKIAGVPASWKLRKKVAEALRDRDIAASTDIKGSTVYELRGKIVKSTAGGRARQVNVVWSLFTPAGKRVGQATQFASLPDQTNEDVVEAVADSAAESIAPIVPSSRLAYADSINSGEASQQTRKLYEKRNPQTAIGKMGLKKSGVARNLKAHVDAKTGPDSKPRATTAAKTTAGALQTRSTVMSRRLSKGPSVDTRVSAVRKTEAKSRIGAKASAPAKQSGTALGRLGTGRSALSRNLARGIDKRAAAAKTPTIMPAKKSATKDLSARKLASLSTASGGRIVRKPAQSTPRKKPAAQADQGRRVLTEFYLPRRPKRQRIRRPVRKPAVKKAPVTRRPIATAPLRTTGRKIASLAD